jgi:monoamine oxidase
LPAEEDTTNSRISRIHDGWQGNCHFAGEHMSIDFQGYLNGAVETGQRAAADILADLK